MSATTEPMVYIGVAPCCKHVCAVTMDDGATSAKTVAKTVAGFIRDGLTVEHVTLSVFRAMRMERCCKYQKRQQP